MSHDTRPSPPPARQPLKAEPFINQFIDDLRRQEVAELTMMSYWYDLVGFWRWFEETIGDAATPDAVTPTDIRDHRSHLVNVQKFQPSTVNRRLAALRRFFRWAKGRGFIKEPPTENVKGVLSAPRSPLSLEKREVDRLIRTVERHGNKRDLAILLTLRHTGIRVSELCALTLGDIEISERKGTLVVRSGKGRKYRSLPLNADVRKALKDYQEVRPTVGTDALFVGQRGTGVSSRAVELLVTKYARLAGLEGMTPHTLRHSFGKHALDAGADLVSVAALLGHERLETTAIYTTPSQRDLERVVEKLEQDGDLR
ncbi:MAG: tyrosine-type recombinase/integrase [Chloroflexi bacterium]|nr:tyrosine-type recombinase/integrase [Chloroflexota bacterium]